MCAECDEHDARDQRALLADEGQPSVVDPESLPVQRSGTHTDTHTHLSLISQVPPFTCLSNRLNANFTLFLCTRISSCSQGGLCEVQRHALGSGGPQRPEGHQPELAAHAAGGRRIKPL